MDVDDQPMGRVLSRREVLALFGLAGIGLLAGCSSTLTSTVVPTSPTNPTAAVTRTGTAATELVTVVPTPLANVTATAEPTAITASAKTIPACVVRPEVTEGPYYVNENLNRSDVRSDPGTGVVKAGALLELTFVVSQVGGTGCTPLPNAKVDIWHCDAAGAYSDVSDPGFNTRGQQFLRGYQMTDANGKAIFTTIYPGWYRGRAIHIHFKVHPTSNTVFTSQVFFDDTLSDQVLAQEPYSRRGKRDTLNRTDGIFNPQLLVKAAGTGQGYTGTFEIGVQAV